MRHSGGITTACSERDMDKVPDLTREQRVADAERYATLTCSAKFFRMP